MAARLFFHSGRTSSGFSLRWAKTVRFRFARSAASCQQASMARPSSEAVKSKEPLLVRLVVAQKHRLHQGLGQGVAVVRQRTGTPNSSRILAALRRMTSRTAPSTGLLAP